MALQATAQYVSDNTEHNMNFATFDRFALVRMGSGVQVSAVQQSIGPHLCFRMQGVLAPTD